MVNALDSGSSGLGSSPGCSHYVVLRRDITLTVFLFTQMYKWVLANMLG